MNRLTIVRETAPSGQDPYIIALLDEAGDVLDRLEAHPIEDNATGAAAQLVIDDLRSDKARFRDVLIDREILRRALRILQSDPPPDYDKLSKSLHQKLRQTDDYILGNHNTTQGNTT